MYTILRSSVFAEWLDGLTDEQAKARILARILSAEKGNFGDCAPVGGGISEMRVHVGAGYRVYSAASLCICCCAAATSPRRTATSSGRKRF